MNRPFPRNAPSHAWNASAAAPAWRRGRLLLLLLPLFLGWLLGACASDPASGDDAHETLEGGQSGLSEDAGSESGGVVPPSAGATGGGEGGSGSEDRGSASGQGHSSAGTAGVASSRSRSSATDARPSEGAGSSAARPSSDEPSGTPPFPNCPAECRALCEALEHEDVIVRSGAEGRFCAVQDGARCARTRNATERLIFPGVRARCAAPEAPCVLDPEPEALGIWNYVCRADLPCPDRFSCIGADADTLTTSCNGDEQIAISCAASRNLPGDATDAAVCNDTRGACESPLGAWCDGDAFLCGAGLACDTSLVRDGPRSAGRCIDLQGPWERCDETRSCTGDTICFGILPTPGAHCAFPCATASDCPWPSTGDTAPICREADGTRLCRLPCASDADCPGDLICHPEGESRFCL